MEISSIFLLVVSLIAIAIMFGVIIQVCLEAETTKTKNKLLLIALSSGVITNFGIIFTAFGQSICQIPQAIIIFGITSTIFFQIWQFYFEYKCQSEGAFFKRQLNTSFQSILIIISSLILSILNILLSNNSHGRCFDEVYSLILYPKSILITTQVIPLIAGVVGSAILLYYLTVKLNKQFSIKISLNKIILPSWTILFNLLMVFVVGSQIFYDSQQDYIGSTSDKFRQIALFALGIQGIFHTLCQLLFRKVKQMPAKTFKSFSAEENSEINNKNNKLIPTVQKKFITDDEDDLPGQQAIIQKSRTKAPQKQNVSIFNFKETD